MKITMNRGRDSMRGEVFQAGMRLGLGNAGQERNELRRGSVGRGPEGGKDEEAEGCCEEGGGGSK
jgi:hypothetical protein